MADSSFPIGLIVKTLRWIVDFFKMPARIAKIAEHSKRSSLAKFCPQCDRRMIVEKSMIGAAWFKCNICKVSLHFKL